MTQDPPTHSTFRRSSKNKSPSDPSGLDASNEKEFIEPSEKPEDDIEKNVVTELLTVEKKGLLQRFKELNDRSVKVGGILLWNFPLFIAWSGYFMAFIKLSLFVDAKEFDLQPMPRSGEEFERAVKITLWIYNHIWIFIVYAALINICFFAIPKKKRFKIVRIAICLMFYIFSILIHKYTTPLAMCLMTSM